MTIQIKYTETRKSIKDKFPSELFNSLFNKYWVNNTVSGMVIYQLLSDDGLIRTHVKEVANWDLVSEIRDNCFKDNNFTDMLRLIDQFNVKYELINQSNQPNNMILCKSGFNYVKNELKTYSGNYLEIGVFNGNSIKDISLAYPKKRIIGIDPFIESGYTVDYTSASTGQSIISQKENTLKNIEGLSNITLYETTSRDFYSKLTDSLIHDFNICAVLIDGDSSYENTKIDLNMASSLINTKPGFILLTDFYIESRRTAFQDFVRSHGNSITLSELVDNNQFTLLIKLN